MKQNKGEAKQEQWYENVMLAIRNSPANRRLQAILKKLEDYPNIPRKEAKFMNFLQNSMNIKERKLAKEVWIAISTAAKQIEDEQKEAEKARNGLTGDENASKGVIATEENREKVYLCP